MITYSDLYEIWRKEKYNEKLQKLTKDFIEEAEEYFKEKKESTKRNEDSIFSEETAKSKKQLENAANIIREIIILRERKILNLGLIAAKTGINKKEIENMLEHEKELFSIVASHIETIDEKIKLLVQGKKEEEKRNKLIRFSQEIPELLDSESKILGPFKKGDVANLPKEIADILIESKQAIFVEN